MDMRRLLKTFGIQADEEVIAFLAKNPNTEKLKLRLTLEDLTIYPVPPESALHLEIEGEILA